MFTLHVNAYYRYKYSLQETNETTAEFVFIFITSIVGRVDLYGNCVSWCIGTPLYISQVTSINIHLTVKLLFHNMYFKPFITLNDECYFNG